MSRYDNVLKVEVRQVGLLKRPSRPYWRSAGAVVTRFSLLILLPTSVALFLSIYISEHSKKVFLLQPLVLTLLHY